MIYSCKIDDIFLPNLKGKEYIFSPGLNVIVGENGSGKTTLLNLLGSLCGTNNGWSEFAPPSYTPEACYEDELLKTYFKGSSKNVHAKLVWDGLPVLYQNYNDRPSEIFGASNNALSDETEFALNFSYCSKGQKQGFKIGKYFQMMKNPLPNILSTLNEPENKLWIEARRRFNDYVLQHKNSCKDSGRGTLLFDELDVSLSLLKQKKLWEDLDYEFPFQIICVSHSYYALECQSANIIEVTDHWKEQCLKRG